MSSLRACASLRTFGETPWAEKTVSAPSGTSADVLDEYGAARGEQLDHVLVVDDLLAHVHGRPMQVERAFDRLHGAIDARAISAWRGEQELLDCVRPLTPL